MMIIYNSKEKELWEKYLEFLALMQGEIISNPGKLKSFLKCSNYTYKAPKTNVPEENKFVRHKGHAGRNFSGRNRWMHYLRNHKKIPNRNHFELETIHQLSSDQTDL